MDNRKPVGVLIVDDSAVVRQVIGDVLRRDPAIEVLAAAPDPLFARRHMEERWPDVILLDIEMPRMDGITFLKQIMAERPTPVVICSTLTAKGTRTCMEAMAAGAVQVVTKPTAGLKQFLQDSAAELSRAVKTAARANIKNLRAPSVPEVQSTPVRGRQQAMAETTERVVAIGTSTGGTQALEAVIRALPTNAPGLVIVQHMPEKFTEMFAQRLDALCQVRVREARHGERILPGHVLIAPGGHHMKVRRSGAQYMVDVVDGPLVSRHKPSVDVLFRSVASSAGSNAAGFLLTGMGDDGARGLRAMRDAGAWTCAQDRDSSVVFGMPRAAIELDAVEEIVSLRDVPKCIMRFGRS